MEARQTPNGERPTGGTGVNDMAKIKIDDALYDRMKKVAQLAGYSSADEFIIHVLERELAELESGGTSDDQVIDRLKGLGYLE